MTPVPLTRPMIDLLLVLLQMNRDLLDHYVTEQFGFKATGGFGKAPDKGDMRMMEELDLTRATIKVLEEAR